jgi:membrane protein YqaA with SNARE-associated domain
MLKRSYDKIVSFSAGPYAFPALLAVSFMESSFSPVLPDILLVPMVLANRERAFALSMWCAVASVLGGMLGYAIGSVLYETVGQWIIHLYNLQSQADRFRELYAQWGAWIILLKGVTPIPYKLVAIVSGMADYNFWAFVGLSFVARVLRFLPEAWLLYHYGAPIQGFIETRLRLVTFGALGIVIFGFALVKYVI